MVDRRSQYHIYLFERILLCCKDINPNKQRRQLMSNSRPPTNQRGKPRLQLKGRIYMANVTEILSLQKPGKFVYSVLLCKWV
jgi:cell division control protein 24